MTGQPSISIKAEASYERRMLTQVLRIETDKMKVCEPKVIRKRRYLVAEEAFVVHVLERGKTKITPIKS